MYYGAIKNCDIANGRGVRVSLFVSGCRNHCKGCFQPETWDFNYGTPYTKETEDEILSLVSSPYIDGITVLGGDPMEPENQEEVCELLGKIKSRLPGKNVWLYTGYVLENLEKESHHTYTKYRQELLSYVDILVDGKFIDEEKDISLQFRGSRNQRVIDMNEYRKTGKITLLHDEKRGSVQRED